ncbi:MAG: pilin [bacterium]|nr:pilin [bacterium]
MFLRTITKYHRTIISFCFGVLVMSSVGGAGFVFIAHGATTVNPGDLKGTPAEFGCPAVGYQCVKVGGGINSIIPQCQIDVDGFRDTDPMRCCNYTLDAFIQMAINIARLILGLSGSVALVMVIYGGFLYLTSAGSPERVKAGHQTLFNAGIGLVIIFSSWLIVNFVMASLVAPPEGKASAADSLNGQLQKFFTGGSWNFPGAQICIPIKFAHIGDVTQVAPLGPNAFQENAGGGGAGELVVQPIPQVTSGITGKACVEYCTVRIDDKPQLRKGLSVGTKPSDYQSFVDYWGDVKHTSGETYLPLSALQDMEKRPDTEIADCKCMSYTKLAGSDLSPSQNMCGTKITMGTDKDAQKVYAIDCDDQTDNGIFGYDDWLGRYGPVFDSQALHFAKQYQDSITNTTFPALFDNFIHFVRPSTQCYFAGSHDALKKFTPALNKPIPKCNIKGYCCFMDIERVVISAPPNVIFGDNSREWKAVSQKNAQGNDMIATDTGESTYSNCLNAKFPVYSKGVYQGKPAPIWFSEYSCSQKSIIDGLDFEIKTPDPVQ